MADLYVSSTAYAAVATWQASHAYVVGDFVRPTAPAFNRQYVFRCTTAGTSGTTEPVWGTTLNSTTTSGTAVFTLISGTSTYGWSAAMGNVYSLSFAAPGYGALAGDRVFVSSDHSESSTNTSYGFPFNGTGGVSFSGVRLYSVNKAGSVPPTDSDLQAGASITLTNTALSTLDSYCSVYWRGFTITYSGNSNLAFGNAGGKWQHYKDCHIVLSGTASATRLTANDPVRLVFDNTTVQFGHVSQAIASTYSTDLTWLNTPSAIAGATLPTTLFLPSTGAQSCMDVVCRGVDFSALTGNILGTASAVFPGTRVLLDGCKINASSARYATATNASHPREELELVNCFDGTDTISERYTPAGKVVTDTTTYLSGGAQDDVGAFSHKMVSSALSNIEQNPLESFWLDCEYNSLGSPKTATIEIVSSASLNNTDIRLVLEYQGTASSPVVTLADSLNSGLVASAALPTDSGMTWNSPPSTPVYQKLQATFTPQVSGRVRARVLLGKASTTVWINPQIAIS